MLDTRLAALDRSLWNVERGRDGGSGDASVGILFETFSPTPAFLYLLNEQILGRRESFTGYLKTFFFELLPDCQSQRLRVYTASTSHCVDVTLRHHHKASMLQCVNVTLRQRHIRHVTMGQCYTASTSFCVTVLLRPHCTAPLIRLRHCRLTTYYVIPYWS